MKVILRAATKYAIKSENFLKVVKLAFKMDLPPRYCVFWLLWGFGSYGWTCCTGGLDGKGPWHREKRKIRRQEEVGSWTARWLLKHDVEVFVWWSGEAAAPPALVCCTSEPCSTMVPAWPYCSALPEQGRRWAGTEPSVLWRFTSLWQQRRNMMQIALGHRPFTM